MLCESCNKNQASIKISEIRNGAHSEKNLCTDCAYMSAGGSMNFDDIVQGFLNSLINQNYVNITPKEKESEFKEKACPNCGSTFREISQTGKIGCSVCYETFEKELTGVINSIQGSTVHQGKFPKKSGADIIFLKKIEDLRKKLSEKVALEEYEEAVMLRDEIKKLEGERQNASK